MLMTVIGVVSLLNSGYRKIVFKVWQDLTQNIAAACPGCPAETRWRFR
jgi:hypothetical protein